MILEEDFKKIILNKVIQLVRDLACEECQREKKCHEELTFSQRNYIEGTRVNYDSSKR